jgi:hypothetical protein
MGNSITTQNDSRFQDSLLSNEIKDIIMNQTDSYLDDPQVKINLAKACCNDVIRQGISSEVNKIISIAFPKALSADPTQSNYDARCAKDGICLITEYVGLQIDDSNKDKYCGSVKEGVYTPGIAGNFNFSPQDPNSMCNNFMKDSCAKNLYKQGCILVKKDKDGNDISVFASPEENKMCWDSKGEINYGPPECQCLNSVVGPNLNTNPSRTVPDFKFKDAEGVNGNPYGLTGDKTSSDNQFSRYSLNIFNVDQSNQRPNSMDSKCSKPVTNSGVSEPYKINEETTTDASKPLCISDLNYKNSNIKGEWLKNIKQDPSCPNLFEQSTENRNTLTTQLNEFKIETNYDVKIPESNKFLVNMLAVFPTSTNTNDINNNDYKNAKMFNDTILEQTTNINELINAINALKQSAQAILSQDLKYAEDIQNSNIELEKIVKSIQENNDKIIKIKQNIDNNIIQLGNYNNKFILLDLSNKVEIFERKIKLDSEKVVGNFDTSYINQSNKKHSQYLAMFVFLKPFISMSK